MSWTHNAHCSKYRSGSSQRRDHTDTVALESAGHREKLASTACLLCLAAGVVACSSSCQDRARGSQHLSRACLWSGPLFGSASGESTTPEVASRSTIALLPFEAACNLDNAWQRIKSTEMPRRIGYSHKPGICFLHDLLLYEHIKTLLQRSTPTCLW